MNTISKRILLNVALTPHKVAIVDQDGTRKTTWAELQEIATKIACHARREGLQGIVPILQGRTMEYIASILGLNMAGLAVVNLSDNYPQGRIQSISRDVGATVCADTTFVERALAFPLEAFELCRNSDDIAMLCYTSGSTGTPKGIVYTNHCLIQSMERNIKQMSLDSTVIYANTSVFSFAIMQFEMLATLAAGATLHILTDDCRRDVHALSDYFNHHRITHAFVPFQIFQLLDTPLPFLKLVVLAGEKITHITLQSYKVMICYAMSETTAFVTYFTLDKDYEQATPIGKPSDDMYVYLLDENGCISDEGEICVAGPIAKGYWNLPELTGKTFVPNPFATGEHDKVLLHTGDIGKYLPDGNLLYLNRKDWMVKINGQRVEPGEIETILYQLPAIKQAVVKVFENNYTQNYLCVFYTENSLIDKKEINTYLKNHLPNYMQPQFFVKLKEFPVNENGKLDRLSLLAPNIEELQNYYIEPETPEEHLLCDGFEEVLHLPQVGVMDDFFELGGDSLCIIELKLYCESLQVSSLQVLDGRTPRGIAKLLKASNKCVENPYADCYIKRSFYPLTESQKVVLNACLAAPQTDMYIMQFSLTFSRKIDAERLRAAILHVLDCHPVFKVKIVEQNGVYGMIPCPERTFPIPIINGTEEAYEAMKMDVMQYIDLEKEPLLRGQLYQTDNHLYLLLAVHHIISDGTSLNHFFEQVSRAYAGNPLITEEITLFELSNYEQKLPQNKNYEQIKNHFVSQLSKCSIPSHPAFDHPAYEKGAHPSKAITRVIEDSQFLERLNLVVRSNGLVESTFFIAAFAYLLQRKTLSSCVQMLVTDDGRNDARLFQTQGALMRDIPLVVGFEEDSFITHLHQIQRDFFKNAECYEGLRDVLESEYGMQTDICYVYQGSILNSLNIDGREVEIEVLPRVYLLGSLLVMVFKKKRGFEIRFIYNGMAYEEKTIQSLADNYIEMLQLLSEQKIDKMDLLN